jgi:anthranilate synthase component 1
MTDRPARGEVTVLKHPLSASLEPLQLYAHLSGDGARSDTMLFERPDGPTFVLDQAALRIESRGSEVTAKALSNNGLMLLNRLKSRLAERVIESAPGTLAFRFPQIDADNSETRLKAPGHFDVLRELTIELNGRSRDPFAGFCMGVIAYDHVDFHEKLPDAEADLLDFPDFVFWAAESLIVFEPGVGPSAICTALGSPDSAAGRENRRLADERLVELVARCEGAPALPTWSGAPRAANFSDVDLDDPAFEALVEAMKAHIRAGDVYQIVPSRTFRAPCPDPFRAFCALRSLERAPYCYFISEGRHQIFGASPEAAVRVTAEADGLVVETNPIAGTRPRGATPDEDDRLEADLRTDAKELAEHIMLVDLARNDVARISVAGTRHASSLMQVKRHARVMHLESRVQGQLRPDLDAFHAAQANLNVGTLSGAPKIRAMQLLREAEPSKRGPYGGAIGWINGRGEMDSAVVIRTAVVRNGTAFVRAGAGIVQDSDPQAEALETRHKAAAVLAAIAGAAP